MKALQRFEINPKNAIMIIVDMENEFCKKGGRLFTETSARIMPGVIESIKGLAARIRSAGIPVIYIQSVRTGKEPDFTVFGVEPNLQIGTWASEIIEELKPQQHDIIVQKFSHDPFLTPELDNVLKKLVPDPTSCCAVVTGGAVNVCVYHTTMGFHLRNYWTVVPVDCVYYMTDAGKERALEQFSDIAPYPNIFLSRSDFVKVSSTPLAIRPSPVP